MAASIEAKVTNEVLTWARETIGLSTGDVAASLDVEPGELLAWEAGEARPTVSMLRKIAHLYKRPLTVFFLPKAPPTTTIPHDFRRLPGEGGSRVSSALLLTMRAARRRREAALELCRSMDIEVAAFPLKAEVGEDPDSVAGRLRRFLGVTLTEQAGWKREGQPLRGWIDALESRGILVGQTGAVPETEMRGFSLADRLWPSIILNSKDAANARVFTLMHECAHLMLHRSGVCNPFRDFRSAGPSDERLEAYCNQVAGATLVPTAELLARDEVRSHESSEWPEEVLRTLARSFAVSREVILRRLLTLRLTTEAFYATKRTQYAKEWAAKRSRDAELAKLRDTPIIIPPHKKRLSQHGRKFTSLVLEAYDRETITASEASSLLGLKVVHFDRLAGELRGGDN